MNTKVFDTLLEPTFVINFEKKIIYCNEPAALILESTPRKIMRQNPMLDVTLQFSDSVGALSDLSQINEPSAYQEVSFKTESGRTGKVQLTVQPFGEGECLVFFRDVTLEETLQKKYRGELEQKESVILDLQKARDELKNYAENLEKMVEARTQEIMSLNQTMSALLDSLTQGFFIFDHTGMCLPVFSKACEVTLESKPAGRPVWEVLKVPERLVPGFRRWLPTLFSEMLPFKDLAPLGPQDFPHSKDRKIQLDYYPVRSDKGEVKAVVVVSTDITDLVVAQNEAEVEKAQSKMILSLVSNKPAASAFVRESRTMLRSLNMELASLQPSFESLFRDLHTLKGAMGSFHVRELQTLCHEAENCLTQWRESFEPESQKKWMNSLVEKSVLLSEGFENFIEKNSVLFGNAGLSGADERWIEFPLSKALDFLRSHPLAPAAEQDFLFNLMGISLEKAFSHFNDVAHEVAELEGKVILPLQFVGGQIQIAPEPYSNLFASLTHAYRNAVDHGIEKPEVRTERGKPQAGRIVTSFKAVKKEQTDWLHIEVQDDGGGISVEAIRQKLTARGADVRTENDHQIIQHVFDSSFSTKEVVTQTSGRGVGMDAIKEAAQSLGGHVEVFSSPEQGSRLVVQVPRLDHVTWFLQKHLKKVG